MLSPTRMGGFCWPCVVILVGGKKLPELGSGLGKGISEFKKAHRADKPRRQRQIKESEAKTEDAKPNEPK